MDYNVAVAQQFANVFDFATRVRNQKPIDKIWSTRTGQRGADLCFVDITLSLGGAEFASFSFCAKILPKAGRFLALNTQLGGDDKRHLSFVVSNELRAVMTALAFENPKIAALAKKYERQLAGKPSAATESSAVADAVAEIRRLREELAAARAELASSADPDEEEEEESEDAPSVPTNPLRGNGVCTHA